MTFFHPKVLQKIGASLLFIFIYVLASKLPLPFVDVSKSLALGGVTQGLQLTAAITGGNLRAMSFISVGLSPWMSSMLLWRMFDVSEKGWIKQKGSDTQARWQMYLTLIISLIQSLAISLNLSYQTGIDQGMAMLLATVLLVAGTFFLIWLVDLNSIFGIGGSLTIMMVSMLLYLPLDISQTMEKLQWGWEFILALGVIGLVMLYIAVFIERSKYRVPVQKVMIQNVLRDYTFIDLKLNPAGGLPFMYAMTIVQIPVYSLLAAKLFFPRRVWIDKAIQTLGMGQPLWFLLYAITILILAFAFAYINVDARKIAKNMQRSGEFIDHVYPGQTTYDYLTNLLKHLAPVGALYLLFFAVAPMSMVLYDADLLRLSMIPGIFLIFFGMVFVVQDEVAALTVNENYTRIL